MAQPRYISQTGVGTSDWQIVNWDLTPINIGIGVIVSGTVTYSVEYTLQDPSGTYPGGTPTAFSLSALASKTATLDGSIITPVAAIRLNVTAGTGTAQMCFLQAGIEG